MNYAAKFSALDVIADSTAMQSGGKLQVLYDSVGLPSVMNYIPKFSLSGDVLPAFIIQSGTAQAGSASTITLAADASATDDKYQNLVIQITAGTGSGQSREVSGYNGTTKVATMADDWTTPPDDTSIYQVEIDGFYVSTYQNVVYNSKAYSLPWEDPKVYVNYDAADAACTAKGAGWHLFTNAEWAAIALWCKANGFQPRGNNNYGKDVSQGHETGKVCHKYVSGGTLYQGRTLTGSGPSAWCHDNTPFGITDLNGNIWEWVRGLKITDKLATIQHQNNFEELEANWLATGVDITDSMSSGNKILTLRSDATFKNLGIPLTSDATGSADYGNDGYWFTTTDERLALRGGRWNDDTVAGVFALGLSHTRTFSLSLIGFRSSFVSLAA